MTIRLSLFAFLLASPALAQQSKEPDKPITEKEVSAGDVAATPITDLNLRKGQIPKLLIDAQDRPYDLKGLKTCPQIAAAVGELDAVLGEDIDTANARGGGLKAGNVAQAAVGAFIPFRGLIREVSGANAQEKKVQAAVYAGSVRRAFLKGVGQQRGCRYPARPATHADIAALQAVADAQSKALAKSDAKTEQKQSKKRKR